MEMPRTAFRVWASSFNLEDIDEIASVAFGLSAAELGGNSVSSKARNLQEFARRRGTEAELALFEEIIVARPNLEEKLVAAGWEPRGGDAAAPVAATTQPTATTTVTSTTSAPTSSGLQYENFDLRIRTKDSDGRYRMEVARNPEGMEMFDDVKQSFPLDDYDFVDLVDYLSDLIGKGSDAKELGKMMYKLLFPGRIGEIFFANMNSVRRQGKGLRIRLRIDAPELSKLPWEYCYSDDFGFFALDPRTPLVRYVGRPFQSPALTIPNPIRVLLVIAAPTDQAELNVAEEEQRIRQWVNILGNRAEIDVVSGRSTASKMRTALGNNPQIIHFIGHGEFKNDLGRLVFEDDYQLSTYQDSEQLRVMLAGRDVKVVILNACKSAAGSAHAAFAGVAPALVEADIPAVIAMQFNVPDATALGFTKDLYRYLMSGYPLDQAVTEMRSGAFGNGDDKYFWGIPVLYMRSPDGRLWEPDAELLTKFEEARQSAKDLAGPTLADLLQQIKKEVNGTSDIDDRDKDYIMRGLDDGLKAINERNARDVDYYLGRAIEDLKRSRSETAEKKIVPKVESVMRQAKAELA
jgi:hypothetical protein